MPVRYYIQCTTTDSHVESDVWDVSHPSKVVYPDGSEKEHWHRIQPVSIEANFDGITSRGTGSQTFTIAGRPPAWLEAGSAQPTYDPLRPR